MARCRARDLRGLATDNKFVNKVTRQRARQREMTNKLRSLPRENYTQREGEREETQLNCEKLRGGVQIIIICSNFEKV